MFSALAQAPAAPLAGIVDLRLSLNTPVVAIAQLPVGPAAAAIALGQGARGPMLVLVLRSVRTGQAVFFAPDESLDARAQALPADAALAFAESMGFLFDEGTGTAAEAAERWAEFLEPTGLAADEALEAPAAAARTPVLSKFRLHGPLAGGRRSGPLASGQTAPDVWVRLLSRF